MRVRSCTIKRKLVIRRAFGAYCRVHINKGSSCAPMTAHAERRFDKPFSGLITGRDLLLLRIRSVQPLGGLPRRTGGVCALFFPTPWGQPMKSNFKHRGWIAGLLGLRSPRARQLLASGDSLSMKARPDTDLLGDNLCIALSDGEFAASDTRNWPVSLHEVPAWRLDDEWVAKGRGYKLPNYRTRGEYESMVARCADAIAEANKETLPAELRPMLPAHEAAAEFAAWMRDSGHVGTLSNEAITTLYADCCAALNRVPSADNTLREALKRLPGVSKTQPNLKSQNGRRHRPIFWTVALAASQPREHLARAA